MSLWLFISPSQLGNKVKTASGNDADMQRMQFINQDNFFRYSSGLSSSFGQLIQTSKVPPTSWPTSAACTLTLCLHVLRLIIWPLTTQPVKALIMLEEDRADFCPPPPAPLTSPYFSAPLNGNESFLLISSWVSNFTVSFTLLNQAYLYSYLSYFFSLDLFLWIYIPGFWVNLRSFYVVQLLSNSSSASWNLQIRSSFKQHVFP